MDIHQLLTTSRTPIPWAYREARDLRQKNSRFLALPVDIILLILDEFSSIRESDVALGQRYLPLELEERTKAIRALSQTCRAWRQAFLPLLWARFLVVFLYGKEEWYQQLSESLGRKCVGLTEKSPHLRIYIRTVTVTITKRWADRTVPLFANCLASMPNLDTIQIMHSSKEISHFLRDSFADKCLKNVKSIIIQDYAHFIMRACPNVTKVTCIGGDGKRLIGAIVKDCKKVDELYGIQPTEGVLKRLADVQPTISRVSLDFRDLSVYTTDGTDQYNLKLLRPLKYLENLDRIEIIDAIYHIQDQPDQFKNHKERLEEIANAVKTTLLKRAKHAKELVVTYEEIPDSSQKKEPITHRDVRQLLGK
ncbi:hypothetical protein ABKN59_005950 [Abortiporus biennis]